MTDLPATLYRTSKGVFAEADGRYYFLGHPDWDELFNSGDIEDRLRSLIGDAPEMDAPDLRILLPPIANQEVWAAGVTYMRSRTARRAEAAHAGGGDIYDRVYEAQRPELFFKASPHRVVGQGQDVRIRRDSSWSVPEPELALAVNRSGKIVGYSVANDMSARDIEGDNPLYLPQAKVYDQCCALGPGLLIRHDPMPEDAAIELAIRRADEHVFEGSTTLASLKRSPEVMVHYLFRDNSFPHGCFLLTGTGIVPPDSFSLRDGDHIRISIDSIGTLENRVVQYHD